MAFQHKKFVTLPDGSLVEDRRAETGAHPQWIIPIIIFLATQTVGGIWWASAMNTKMEFVTQIVAELKQSIKEERITREVINGNSRVVIPGSIR